MDQGFKILQAAKAMVLYVMLGTVSTEAGAEKNNRVAAGAMHYWTAHRNIKEKARDRCTFQT